MDAASEMPKANYSRAIHPKTYDLSPLAWHVSVLHEGEMAIVTPDSEEDFNFHFARKQDAEAAAANLIREGLVNAELIQKAGWKKVRRIMCEALAW